MKKHIISTLFVLLLSACGGMPESSEMVLGEGEIKAINTKKLLIQEKTSVVRLDYGDSTGNYLMSRYKAGQSIKLVGIKTIDEMGLSRETINAIIFEDGMRFNING